MTIKRSYRHLFMGSLGVALLLANCTVKEDNDDRCEKGDKDVGCDCPGNAEGFQECGSNGVFGACICPDGASGSGNTSGSGNNGGSSEDQGGAPGGGGASAGANTGGASEGGAGGSSEGGAGGEAPFAFINCDECMETLCATELEACLDDDLCLEQYADVTACIEADRENNNVSRDRLRDCATVGASADPDPNGSWAPDEMTPEAITLINCLATSSSEVPNGDWADVDGPNFPESGPTPWPADSCAKLACTSKK